MRLTLSDKKFDLVIFIRDADGIRTQDDKLKKRREWYARLAKMVNGKTLLLLNIASLEALILADIDSFAKYYNVRARHTGDVTMEPKPFKYLRDFTDRPKTFEKSSCPAVFETLDLDTVRKRCNYFDSFFQELEAFIGK